MNRQISNIFREQIIELAPYEQSPNAEWPFETILGTAPAITILMKLTIRDAIKLCLTCKNWAAFWRYLRTVFIFVIQSRPKLYWGDDKNPGKIAQKYDIFTFSHGLRFKEPNVFTKDSTTLGAYLAYKVTWSDILDKQERTEIITEGLMDYNFHNGYKALRRFTNNDEYEARVAHHKNPLYIMNHGGVLIHIGRYRENLEKPAISSRLFCSMLAVVFEHTKSEWTTMDLIKIKQAFSKIYFHSIGPIMDKLFKVPIYYKNLCLEKNDSMETFKLHMNHKNRLYMSLSLAEIDICKVCKTSSEEQREIKICCRNSASVRKMNKNSSVLVYEYNFHPEHDTMSISLLRTMVVKAIEEMIQMNCIPCYLRMRKDLGFRDSANMSMMCTCTQDKYLKERNKLFTRTYNKFDFTDNMPKQSFCASMNHFSLNKCFYKPAEERAIVYARFGKGTFYQEELRKKTSGYWSLLSTDYTEARSHPSVAAKIAHDSVKLPASMRFGSSIISQIFENSARYLYVHVYQDAAKVPFCAKDVT